MAQPFLMHWTFRDFQGRTAIVRFWVSTLPADVYTVAGQQAELLEALTNATVTSFLAPPNEVVYGSNDLFFSAQDKAEFVFQDTVGGIHRVQIPCPQSIPDGNNIFLGDGLTINPANTAVNAWTTQMIAQACNRNGTLWTLFIGGQRIRRKLPRRLNIFVNQPSGGAPAE